VVSESDYYPYGGERVISNTLTPANNYKFTGHERDAESGLDHTLNRQYGSNTGRFLSPDTVHGKASLPQSWNRYAYVGGNPLNRLDPEGKFWICVEYGGSDDYGNQDCVNWEDAAQVAADIAAWQSFTDQGPKERKQRQKEIDNTGIINWLRAQQKQAPDSLPLFPFAIRESDMCSKQSPLAGYELDVTYQVVSNLGTVMTGADLNGFSISESFPWHTGSGVDFSRPGTWSVNSSDPTAQISSTTGQFTDVLYSGSNNATYALQEFTADFSSGSLFANQPLNIIFNGASMNGVNSNYYTSGTVTVNGMAASHGCGQ
jgi:RHS repeat-associated protein